VFAVPVSLSADPGALEAVAVLLEVGPHPILLVARVHADEDVAGAGREVAPVAVELYKQFTLVNYSCSDLSYTAHFCVV
jgi:hypothetical protein